MIDPSGTELVFEELRRSYSGIVNSRRFPGRFRQHFDTYLYKSHQLTEVMRREYKAATGLVWVASDFNGWNVYTAAIKALRNAVAHGAPLTLHESILTVYPAVAFVTDSIVPTPRKLGARIRLTISTCFVDLPFQEEIITPYAGYLSIEGEYIYPLKEFVSYEIPWHILEAGARAALRGAKTCDVVRLVLHSYPVLLRYYMYYQSKLQENEYKFTFPTVSGG